MKTPSFSYRSEEHTSELQSPYVISYAVFCLKKKRDGALRVRHRTAPARGAASAARRRARARGFRVGCARMLRLVFVDGSPVVVTFFLGIGRPRIFPLFPPGALFG